MTIHISNRTVGAEHDPFIILEAGINHNGDLALAKEMVLIAKKCGADAIKFQTFTADEFIGDPELMFSYKSQGQQVTEPMLDMFRRYEFSAGEWFEIKKACDTAGILFLSTPQNVSDLELLLKIGVPALKVGSDDFTNLPLLSRYASEKIPLIMSCGMADLGEVYDAIEATGAMCGNDVLLMLCTAQYPTPPEDANLSKLRTLAGAFPGLHLGFSDHTQGPYAAVAACALGACAFEKHFTVSQDLAGPDHWFSENPESASDWVTAIRMTHKLLGSPAVRPTATEMEMRRLARRSITALKDIRLGEAFTEDNLGLRRPGDGLSPKLIHQFLGKTARKCILKGAQTGLGDIN